VGVPQPRRTDGLGEVGVGHSVTWVMRTGTCVTTGVALDPMQHTGTPASQPNHPPREAGARRQRQRQRQRQRR
jgi:hypothetical protein